jgi:hypothetical protein
MAIKIFSGIRASFGELSAISTWLLAAGFTNFADKETKRLSSIWTAGALQVHQN